MNLYPTQEEFEIVVKKLIEDKYQYLLGDQNSYRLIYEDLRRLFPKFEITVSLEPDSDSFKDKLIFRLMIPGANYLETILTW